MKIVDLIKRDMVVPALNATDKRGILEELAAYMAGHHPRIDRAMLSKVLIEREQLASTAIGEGVAIPHGKLAAVGEIVACLGRAPTGVEFDSMDGQPTDNLPTVVYNFRLRDSTDPVKTVFTTDAPRSTAARTQ